MKNILVAFVLVMSSLTSLTASAGRGDSEDAIVKYCLKRYADYPSLYQSCLRDNDKLYVDNAFGDYCETRYTDYPSLWLSCLKDNANRTTNRGFGSHCKSRYADYPSLWLNCLKENSKAASDSDYCH